MDPLQTLPCGHLQDRNPRFFDASCLKLICERFHETTKKEVITTKSYLLVVFTESMWSFSVTGSSWFSKHNVHGVAARSSSLYFLCVELKLKRVISRFFMVRGLRSPFEDQDYDEMARGKVRSRNLEPCVFSGLVEFFVA